MTSRDLKKSKSWPRNFWDAINNISITVQLWRMITIDHNETARVELAAAVRTALGNILSIRVVNGKNGKQ